MTPAPRSFPLGHAITGSAHSVVVSLPTRADVVGYEEGVPAVCGEIAHGYPRFVEHRFIRAWREQIAQAHGWDPARTFLAANADAARALVDLAVRSTIARVDYAWQPAMNPEIRGRAIRLTNLDLEPALRGWLKQSGLGVSSREAEDALADRFSADDDGEAAAGVARYLGACYGADPRDIWLCRGGMHALFTGLEALRAVMARRGRRRWLQLGWLYCDTMGLLLDYDLLDGRAEEGDASWSVLDVHDKAAVEAIFRAHGPELAGVITETPTNPTLQMPDVLWLRDWSDRAGCALVLDPTAASPYNANVYPHADLHINSLTKYAAPDADVMLGALALNPASTFYTELRQAVQASSIAPPYAGDLVRLAGQIPHYRATVTEMNATAAEVAAFLEQHARVDRVWWVGSATERAWGNLAAVAGPLEGSGALISFTVKGDWMAFYDALEVAKGPSFGARFTLVCPYMYLAHYDLVKARERGTATVGVADIPSDLIRLSVGLEAPAEIIAALERALKAAG